MPQSAGSTTELYSDANNPGSTLGAPPSAPAPVPPPTQPVVVTQPVVTKGRMADEGPDGRIRDTSMEALTPSKDLGFRNITDESENAPKAKPEEPKPADAAPAVEAPKAEQPPVAEKVYAGKFKSVEELEKSYEELQSRNTKAMQEAAELRKRNEAPPAPVVKTPEQVAIEEAKKTKFLADFVADPEKVITDYQQRAVQQTQIALGAQELTNKWRKDNSDLVEHEYFVAAEAMRLAQSDPEIAKDPSRLMQSATDNFRAITGKLRTEGAKEALTQQTRVIPLLSNTAPAAATEQPSQKAPLSSDDAYSTHMRMLKEQEQKSHRGLRR